MSAPEEKDRLEVQETKMEVEDDKEEEEEGLSDSRLKKLVPGEYADPAQRESLEILRDLQIEHDDVFAEYLREKQELEEKYEAKFAPFFVKRKRQLDEKPLDLFWFKVFEHCEALRENITDRDALALKYLVDVSSETVTKPGGDLPIGSFKLFFRFADNPFFENDLLTKTYIMNDEDFEELEEARGSKVLWKQGKDLTMRTMKKKAKNGRVLIKKQQTDSFFNFFNPPQGLVEDGEFDEQQMEELEDVMEADYDLGECIRGEVIPRAFLYYLNIADGEEDDEGDEDGDDLGRGDGEDGDADDEGENEENGRREAQVSSCCIQGKGCSLVPVGGYPGRASNARCAQPLRDATEESSSDESASEEGKQSGLPPAAKSPEECKQQ